MTPGNWGDRARDRAEQRLLARRVTAMLQEAYAAPENPEYWDDLHARIMGGIIRPRRTFADRLMGVARLSADSRTWRRAGLAAACLAALAAGIATWQSRRTEARVAFETVLGNPAAVPVLNATRFINVSEQEATELYVTSH